MKDNVKKEVVSIEEMEKMLLLVSQMNMENFNSSFLQQQNIDASYLLVVEDFDMERKRAELEFLDNKERNRFGVAKEVYQYLFDRPMHRHSYFEIMIVLSGSLQHHIEEETFTYRGGQGCFMNMNIRHKEIPATSARVLAIGIKKEILGELLEVLAAENSTLGNTAFFAFLRAAADGSGSSMDTRRYWDFSPVSDKLADQNKVISQWEFVLDAIREKRPGYSYLFRAVLLRFLADICDPSLYTLQCVSSDLNRKEFLVSKITFLIHAFHGKITKKELERHLSYHGDYLNRIFKQQTGKSISKYCSEVTIQQAQNLLRDTQLSVESIMERLHISSRGHFFKLFQEQTGMTPREYRQSVIKCSR